MSSPATEMGQGKRKAADDDDEWSAAATGSAYHEAKRRKPHTNTDDNTSADTCAVDDALPPSSSSQSPKPMPHIPAPVWGHVLDYMPYGEVRSALLLGKIIATEAAKHVQTLNIMNSWEMDVPAARRFHSLRVMVLRDTPHTVQV